MTHETDTIVTRIMSIRNGMTLDADAEALIRDALDARQTSPETASVRDAFEAWATSDNRAIQPLQFEERTDANNHYYESGHDNNAFIGWKAAGHAPSPAWPSDGEMLKLLEAAGFDTQLTHPSCYYAFSWKTFTEKLRAALSHSSTTQNSDPLHDSRNPNHGRIGGLRVSVSPPVREGE
jgi:hypothetical protein